MNPALRALNRFGLGARPGEASALGDPRSWLMAQLDERPPLLDDPSLPTPDGLSEAIRALRRLRGRVTPRSSVVPGSAFAT